MQSEATNRRAELQLALLSVLYDQLDLFCEKEKHNEAKGNGILIGSLRTKRFKVFKTRLDIEIKID